MVGSGSEESGMEDCGEDRCWEDLARDALGIIFCKLSLQEILTVVPGVCKPWSRVVSGPDCWQDIDIQEWSQQSEPDQITSVVHMHLARSAGSCHRLSVSRLPNDSLFAFIADHAQSLKILEIPRSEISDSIVEDVAPRLTKVTFLDVSSCTKIGARALEAFSKNCKSLVRLRRVMHPMDVAGKVCHNDEARAIAYNMPKLCYLEIGYMLITTTAVVEITSQCEDLKFLDLRGCWDVDDKILQEKYPGLKILGPHVDHCYENSLWDECSDDDSINSWEEFVDDDYFAIGGDDEAIWDDEHALEGLEIRLYGGVFGEGVAGFDWPESPRRKSALISCERNEVPACSCSCLCLSTLKHLLPCYVLVIVKLSGHYHADIVWLLSKLVWV